MRRGEELSGKVHKSKHQNRDKTMKPFAQYTLTLLGPISLKQAQEWLAEKDDELTLSEQNGKITLFDPTENRHKTFGTVESAVEFCAFILQL